LKRSASVRWALLEHNLHDFLLGASSVNGLLSLLRTVAVDTHILSASTGVSSHFSAKLHPDIAISASTGSTEVINLQGEAEFIIAHQHCHTGHFTLVSNFAIF